jgi:hypothetical protein
MAVTELTVEFILTAEDVRLGTPRSSSKCPFVLALTRALIGIAAHRISIGFNAQFSIEDRRYWATLPDEIMEGIGEYDSVGGRMPDELIGKSWTLTFITAPQSSSLG